MRKQNSVNQLNRTSSHRKAMLANMVTSLLYHERIESTVAKVKVVRQMAEKLITRAKRNQDSKLTSAQKVHNFREARKIIKDREVLQKLFSDIAPRYTDRPGGYTRILRVGARASDASEMALIELVDRKELVTLKEDRKEFRTKLKESKKGSDKKATKK